LKVFDLGTYGTNNASRLMTQCQGFLHNDVAIAVVIEVVEVRTAEASGLNSNLHLIGSWRWEAAVFLHMYHVSRRIKIYPDEATHYSEIFNAMQDRSPNSGIGHFATAVYNTRVRHDHIWNFTDS
jgi:hypothetical protein